MSLLALVTLAALGWPTACWSVIAIVSMLGTAIFAGTEIGIFSLSRVRLRLRTHQGDQAAVTLSGWLREPTYPLEGLLILQNLCSFAFSAAITAILQGWHLGTVGETLLSTLIVTPVILIFCDIVPKDLFHTHAERWVYRMVGVLRWAFTALTIIPVLPLIHALGRFSTYPFHKWGGWKNGGGPVLGPRAEILSLFEESAQTGSLSGTQQDLVQRALRMARITIREVMIPWNRVVGVPTTISRDGFAAVVRHYNISRLPVLGRSATEVLGMVEILDVLGDPEGFDIRRHLLPTMTLIGEQSVRSAITLMQRARQTIAVVVDRQGRAVGLVTMKDLIEELVGDLENW